MSNVASPELESKIAAALPTDTTVTARPSRKFAFRPTIGLSGYDDVNGVIEFAFSDRRDELAATTTDRRKKSVRKHLNKRSRLNGRRALRMAGEIMPTKADAHCAGDLASIKRPIRAEIEDFPKRGTDERMRFEHVRRESFRETERRARKIRNPLPADLIARLRTRQTVFI